jgi:hypothetical protein
MLFLKANIFVYIIFIFITLEISPFNWSDLSRLLYLIMVAIAWGRLLNLYKDDLDDNQE